MLWGCLTISVPLVVLVALLLPAVNSVRYASRRLQSEGNLKQIGLALNSYQETFSSFPAGTVAQSAVPIEDRLSWQTLILPYLDQAPLYSEIDLQAAWNQASNERVAQVELSVFLNPALGAPPEIGDYRRTDYVGVAGLEETGPWKKVNDVGAGVFAYDLPRTLNDIQDGTGNTLMVGEVDKNRGPWIRGGKPTIRPFSAKPYVDGPDGFGGGRREGCQFLMGDGSVRSISASIDPSVMEALTTIAGDETIADP